MISGTPTEGHRRRADLAPTERAVSDALDEYLVRIHGLFTSWADPDSFIQFLYDRGYEVTKMKREDGEG